MEYLLRGLFRPGQVDPADFASITILVQVTAHLADLEQSVRISRC